MYLFKKKSSHVVQLEKLLYRSRRVASNAAPSQPLPLGRVRRCQEEVRATRIYDAAARRSGGGGGVDRRRLDFAPAVGGEMRARARVGGNFQPLAFRAGAERCRALYPTRQICRSGLCKTSRALKILQRRAVYRACWSA